MNSPYAAPTRSFLFTVVIMSILVTLSACSSTPETKAEYPDRRAGDDDAVYGKRDSIFGKGGLNLFGGHKDSDKAVGITVNAYLWRAALDTLSFMPIDKADPFGGTILTQWYSAPNKPGERVKVNVFIIGSELRTDALKVSLFRQIDQNGTWVDVAVDPSTSTQLETTILNRARQIKVAERDTQ
jgi:hypothetical protein